MNIFLYIVLIKRGKIQLVGENRKKWYGGRLYLIHDAPPQYGPSKFFRLNDFEHFFQNSPNFANKINYIETLNKVT